MAILYIGEFSALAGAGTAQTVQAPAVFEQTVAIGAGSVQSVAFKPSTRFVRLQPDVVCSVAFGVNPAATTTSARLAAGISEYFGVNPGDKVAVITNT